MKKNWKEFWFDIKPKIKIQAMEIKSEIKPPAMKHKPQRVEVVNLDIAFDTMIWLLMKFMVAWTIAIIVIWGGLAVIFLILSSLSFFLYRI